MKKFFSSLALVSLVSVPTAMASVNDDIAALTNMSFISGSWNEGEIQVKQRRCAADGSYQDGKYRSFLTYANGSPAVTYDAGTDNFTVYYNYSCRTRTRIVIACSGAQSNTDDTNYNGTIKLTLSVSRQGFVKVDTTKTDLGGHELCGAGLARALTARLQDANI